MPRKKQPRRIVEPPKFKGYAPYGCFEEEGEIEFLYEEYEALKLADYDFLSHHEACELMGISRATFARIYETARRKIAKAFVETRKIKSVYGNVYFEDDWFKCNGCMNIFTIPNPEKSNKCPICRNGEIHLINQI